MKIIRYVHQGHHAKLAVLTEDLNIYDLPFVDFQELSTTAANNKVTCSEVVQEIINDSLPLRKKFQELELLVPIEAPEVWASGVTYLKSMEARNYEATNGKLDAATFYDKVYTAERPELFIKSTNRRTVGPSQEVYLRSDSQWQIPEPELGLVLDHCGEILGYIIGNDMSCRDIEGENPLYLPQAKIWKKSCAIGPAIRLADTIDDPYDLNIMCRIYRNDQKVFEQEANTSQLKRKYDELVSYLIKDNDVFNGTVLLTGTSIVPPNDFTLHDGDRIEIEIPEIGVLENIARKPSNRSVTTF